MKYKTLLIFLIPLFLFCFTNIANAEYNYDPAEDRNVAQIPETIDEAKQMGEGMLPLIPTIVKGLWTDGTKILKSFFGFAENFWNKYIFPLADKYIISTVKKRSPRIGEEFNKEKEEMKGEIKTVVPEVSKSLWQKLKELIK